MAKFLYRLGQFAFRRRWPVAFAWVLLLVLAGFGAASASTNTSSQFSVPGTQAQQAFDLLSERFPGTTANAAIGRVVFKAPAEEKITDQREKAAVEQVIGKIKAGSTKVASINDPYQTNAVSKDGTTAYAVVNYNATSLELKDADHDSLKDAAQSGRDAGLTVEIGGSALQSTPETGATELIGIGMAALVLVITFGSLVAAGLPLITAIIGVGITVSAITALSSTLGLDSSTPILATMLGLAVGIDYALFIVSRYRAELAEGRDRLEAIGRATGTAGSAVVFAGLTVVIALAGLAVVNIPFLTKMGLAASAAVVVAVLIAITLIPAVLGIAGSRVLSRRNRRNGPALDAKPNMGSRWARFVLRRPVAVLLASVVGLGILAVPVSGIELGLPDDGSQPTSTTQRKAYDQLSDSFGPGFNGPLTIVVDGKGGDAHAAAGKVKDAISGLKDIASVAPATYNKAGDTALISVTPASKPSSNETTDLVKSIRNATSESAIGAPVLVTGQTALNIDVSQRLSDALLPYLALVVGLAFLLLMVVFRSVLVPVKAALGFLLSVAAALGSLVAVFQWGWLSGLFGVDETGPIMSIAPIFMIGVVFGLAMDYEVFLVTRMREAFVHGEEAREAVVTGFRHGARVVTAAALIMTSVFASFITASEPFIRMLGFGLAIAILFDAFVVRMTIVPAVLALLRDSAWWLPRWLDRILPNVDVEGAGLETRPVEPAGEREPVPSPT